MHVNIRTVRLLGRRPAHGDAIDLAHLREYADLLEGVAANIERAPRLSRTVPWWQFRLRAQVAEPYLAVAAVVRAHRVKVFAAQDAEQWRAICESLAAARRDWVALTANAPTAGPTRRGRLVPWQR